MEQDENHAPDQEWRRVMSPEIVEIGEEYNMSFASNGEKGDVYVAVGKDDLGVLKWAIDHIVSSGSRVFLVHIFPRITHITTPVGRLSRSQLSPEQMRYYINEENNRRKNLLQKYIKLCKDAKVTVDTMLVESNATSKAIIDLIPVLNIANLVMGTNRLPSSRRLMKKVGKGEFVKKNAPGYCEVSIIHEGKKVEYGQQVKEVVAHSSNEAVSSGRRLENNRHSLERKFSICVCFSG